MRRVVQRVVDLVLIFRDVVFEGAGINRDVPACFRLGGVGGLL